MTGNDLVRATFWMDFIVERGAFPSPTLLRAQFDAAQITEFCSCGCNSFGLRVHDGAAAPIIPPDVMHERGHIAIHEADFTLQDGRSLEIIVFTNSHGNVDYVEVDCCANSYPVPDEILIEGGPYRIWSSSGLMDNR